MSKKARGQKLQTGLNVGYALLLLDEAVKLGLVTGPKIKVETCLDLVRRGLEQSLTPCRYCVLWYLTCELKRLRQDADSAHDLAIKLFNEVKVEDLG